MNTDPHAMSEAVTVDRNIVSLFHGLWRLLRSGLRSHRNGLVAAYLMSLCGTVMIFIGPYFLSELLDTALPAHDTHLFRVFSGAIFLSLVALLICTFLKSFFLGRASERIFLGLRTRLVATLMRKPPDFFSKHAPGDLLTRISNDTDSLSVLFFDYIFWSLSGVTMLLLFVALMIVWEWRLGLFAAVSLPCYAVLLATFQKPISRAAARAREKLSKQNDTVMDLLAGVDELRFYQQVQKAEGRFADSAGAFTAANIRSVLLGEWAFNAMEVFTRLVSLGPFIAGGYLICLGDSTITVGTLIAYNLYMTYIAYTLDLLLVGVTKLSQSAPLIRRIQEILDAPEEEIDPACGVNTLMESTRIVYRNVSFGYVPGKPLIKDFSLTIEPGEKVALIGPSGAGKSTLIGMLTRQLKPESGEILFGGHPIEAYHLPLYLQHFSYVRQQPYIFKTSVRDNIAAGWYHIPMDVIIDAARRVCIHEVIERLPHGYDTLLDEKGANLSGGQRQRLALARALVRDPEILLLDEFTSALDRATEDELLDDIFLNFKKQTLICVTHSQAVAQRFSTIVPIEKA